MRDSGLNLFKASQLFKERKFYILVIKNKTEWLVIHDYIENKTISLNSCLIMLLTTVEPKAHFLSPSLSFFPPSFLLSFLSSDYLRERERANRDSSRGRKDKQTPY